MRYRGQRNHTRISKEKRRKALPIAARHAQFTNNLDVKIYSSRDISQHNQQAIGSMLESNSKYSRITFEDPMKVVYHPKVNNNIDLITQGDVITLLKGGYLCWEEVSVFSKADVSRIKSGMVDTISDVVDRDKGDND